MFDGGLMLDLGVIWFSDFFYLYENSKWLTLHSFTFTSGKSASVAAGLFISISSLFLSNKQ